MARPYLIHLPTHCGKGQHLADNLEPYEKVWEKRMWRSLNLIQGLVKL